MIKSELFLITPHLIRTIPSKKTVNRIAIRQIFKPLHIEIKETLLKARYKRFSLYKNDVGRFKQTYRPQMLKDLLLLKFSLVELRKVQQDQNKGGDVKC